MRFCAWASVMLTLTLAAATTLHAASSEVTAEQAAARIIAARGTAVVVVLFASDCPRSQAFLPAFSELVRRGVPGRAKVLVFATDDEKEPLERYLSANRFAVSPVWIKPWSAGALSAAMTPASVRIGATFDLPLVAVLDANGHSVAQWGGMSADDVSRIARALE